MIRNTAYKPIFPWFGGKSAIADKVWDALGDPTNYVEPFFGSGAVLFLRPGGAGHVETVNDADGFVANFWRALKADPDAVAEYADNPVNECDLHARHLWLVGQRERITDRLCGDVEFYDARSAGYWAWGLCCWIGGEWCTGKGGPWVSENGRMVEKEPGSGVSKRRPHVGNPGQGVNRPLRSKSDAGKCNSRRTWLINFMRSYSDRLREVRVCCGDWSRVCSPATTTAHGLTGVFLDPPYADTAGRDANIYAVDSLQVAHEVREWAIENGNRKDMRIVLAGYEGEHAMPDSWYVLEWQTQGGFAYLSDDEDGAGRLNRTRERLWLSPHCRRPAQRGLFD